MANRAVEFTPKTNAAADVLSATLNFLSGNKDQQAATLILFVEAFSRPSDARTRLAAQLIAKWLDPASLRDAIQAARKIGRTEHHYVSMDDNFAFWTFLYSAKVESNPPRVTVDLRELRKRASSALAMGFSDEQDEKLPEDLRYISAQVQPIYRAWGVHEAELEKLRPYFTEEHLRAKLLPLEIVRTAREDREKIAAPTKPVARQPLTLKKRGPGGG